MSPILQLTSRNGRLAGQIRSANPCKLHRVSAVAWCRLALLGALWSMTSCSEIPDSDLFPAMEYSEVPLEPLEVLRQRTAYDLKSLLAEDSLALLNPTDISSAAGVLVIVDTGNDRLVVMDSMLTTLRVIGRTGGGPGELADPFFVATADSRAWVVDLKNGRLSSFLLNGTFVESQNLPGQIGTLAAGTHGRVYLGARLDGHYMVVVDSTGAVSPFADEIDLAASGTAPAGAYRGTFDLVAAIGDTVHYFENELGILMKFDSDGDLMMARRLPPSIRERLAENNRRQREAFARQGMRVLGAPLAKSLKPTQAGELLLLLADDDPVGLVINSRDYRARALRVPDDNPTWHGLTTASAAVLSGATLYALHAEGVTAYSLGIQPQAATSFLGRWLQRSSSDRERADAP